MPGFGLHVSQALFTNWIIRATLCRRNTDMNTEAQTGQRPCQSYSLIHNKLIGNLELLTTSGTLGLMGLMAPTPGLPRAS